MKIRFRKLPAYRRLCLMKGNQDAGKLCFLFDPQKFRGCPGRSVFSFVYRLRDKQMAVGPVDVGHRHIAQAVFNKRVFRGQAFGAQVAYEEIGGLANFKLLGHSGYYGKPTYEQLQLAAQQIASHFKGPIIIQSVDSIVVQARLT